MNHLDSFQLGPSLITEKIHRKNFYPKKIRKIISWTKSSNTSFQLGSPLLIEKSQKIHNNSVTKNNLVFFSFFGSGSPTRSWVTRICYCCGGIWEISYIKPSPSPTINRPRPALADCCLCPVIQPQLGRSHYWPIRPCTIRYVIYYLGDVITLPWWRHLLSWWRHVLREILYALCDFIYFLGDVIYSLHDVIIFVT